MPNHEDDSVQKGAGILANTRPGPAMNKAGYDMKKEDMDKGDMAKPGMHKGEGMGGKADNMKQKDSMDDEMKRDKKDMMGKSLDPEALNATIELLQKSVNSDPKARQQELFAKGQSAEGLTEAEEAELYKSLRGETTQSARIEDEVHLAMTSNEDLNKSTAMDVGGFLEGLRSSVQDALEAVGGSLQKGLDASEQRELTLTKGMLDLMRMTQAQALKINELEKSLNDWGRAPAHGRRSAEAVPAELQKSQAPGQQSLQLNRRQQIDVLSEMMKSERYSEQQQEQLFHAATAAQMTNQPLSKGLVDEIHAYLGAQHGNRE